MQAAAKLAAPRSLKDYLKGPPRVTQARLAKQLGVNQSMVSMLVKGQRQPRAKLALRLHEITGIPLKTLLDPHRRRPRTKLTKLTTETTD
jgi:transcriptional regulator with XRE-family HTH domain